MSKQNRSARMRAELRREIAEEMAYEAKCARTSARVRLLRRLFLAVGVLLGLAWWGVAMWFIVDGARSADWPMVQGGAMLLLAQVVAGYPLVRRF